MFPADRTELLLNTEGIADVAAVLLKGLDIYRKLDSLADLAVLLGRVLIDEVPATIDILHRIGDDFSLAIVPGLDCSACSINDLTEDIEARERFLLRLGKWLLFRRTSWTTGLNRLWQLIVTGFASGHDCEPPY